jgi:hypothetical protein
MLLSQRHHEQRVNALLKDLDRRGIAQLGYGCVNVRDISGLRELVSSHC